MCATIELNYTLHYVIGSTNGKDEANRMFFFFFFFFFFYVLIGYSSGQDGPLFPDRDRPLCSHKSKSLQCKLSFDHLINPVLIKLVRSRWLDIGQYRAILTSRLSITHCTRSVKRITLCLSFILYLMQVCKLQTEKLCRLWGGT